MRRSLLYLIVMAWAIPPAVAQTPEAPARSLLAPGPVETPPPPIPPPSESAAPPVMAPAPEQATITSIPLPPPVPQATAPTPLAPISLAVPPLPRDPGPRATKSPEPPVISAKLPEPALSPEATPADFLRAARGALAAGRGGEARSALEMAQTRLLDRTVDAGQERVPSDDRAVKQISDAIAALAANDRMTCLRYIEFASQTIGSPLN